MKKLHLLTRLFLLAGLSVNAVSFAQEGPVDGANTAIHNNAHNLAGAEQLYQSWKDNQTLENDPFRRIKDGYTADYYAGVSSLHEGVLSERYAVSIESLNELTKTELLSRKSFSKESWQSAYDLSVDGSTRNVDREVFDEEIADAREQRNVNAAAHYEDMKAMLASYSITASTSYTAENRVVSNNKYDASANIISLMDNEATDNKDVLIAMFDDNLTRVTATGALAASTLEITNEFSSNCPACVPSNNQVAPPPTPPPPPEPPPPPPVYRPPVDRCGIDRDPRWRGDPSNFYKCP